MLACAVLAGAPLVYCAIDAFELLLFCTRFKKRTQRPAARYLVRLCGRAGEQFNRANRRESQRFNGQQDHSYCVFLCVQAVIITSAARRARTARYGDFSADCFALNEKKKH